MEEGGGGGGGSCDDDDDHLLLLMSEDVLIQILLWLPVISLLRFKSVCKSWRSIIESPFFIHLHATTTLPPSSLYTTNKLGCSSSLLFYLVHDDQIDEQIEKSKGKLFTFSGDVFEDLGRPLEEVHDLIVGCCDGIICLRDSYERGITLWNPATKQSRTLPKPSNLLGNPNFMMTDDHYYAEDLVGFGIDVKTMDYKLLFITTLKKPKRQDMKSPGERRVHVYSLSTDSWKCIDNATLSAAHLDLDIDIDVDAHRQGLYLNGRYFFMAHYWIKENFMSLSLILSYDFTEEIFRTIRLPNDWSEYHRYLILLGERIALIDAKDNYDICNYDIWVLNEQHGVKESWTKFYTIGPYRRRNLPRFITDNGEFAIMYSEANDYYQPHAIKLQLLNLITGETKDIQFDCKHLLADVHVYKPSLVPIGRKKGAAENNPFLEFDGTP